MAMAISARRKTDIGKLATDETLNKVVDAIKNSETVQAQKEEIQTGGEESARYHSVGLQENGRGG